MTTSATKTGKKKAKRSVSGRVAAKRTKGKIKKVVATKGVSAKVPEKIYSQACKMAKRNNHSVRQIVEAAFIEYRKGNLAID